MGRFEVQGVVSSEDGAPLVQFQQLDDDGNLEFGFQMSPEESRDLAQKIVEASMNAVYDAALIAWAKTTGAGGEMMGARMVAIIRDFRTDIWGLPSSPENWKDREESGESEE